MQTFIPYPDVFLSLECLDYQRLGKQRVEAHQILNTLTRESNGWKNHPAVRMWRGYETALKFYHNVSLLTWQSRGYKNNMSLYPIEDDILMPDWWGREAIHDSHKAVLKYKNPIWYNFQGIEPKEHVIWP